MAETKPKPADSLRTPKPKKKLGLTVPPALRLPHEDLITSQAEPQERQSTPSQARQTSTTRQTRPSSQARQTSEKPPVSPVRDFTKFANSIHREAVPAGLFTGKGKQLYDCLYSLTRGAVVPARTVRMSRPKLMKKAGIGARVTFDANVERLAAVGLIQVRRIAGEHEGNEYTVFLPEEVGMPSVTSHTSETSHAQKPVVLDGLDSSQTRHTSSVENRDTSAAPKTFINTSYEKNDDDEAFAGLCALLRQTSKEITGREPSPAEAERWKELGELLATELKIAAGRTTVSNVPAFLTEHLRRRLWKKNKRQVEEEGRSAVEGQKVEAKVDAYKCPDCFGTGMWYPEGYEKGVAKCRHEKLNKAE